MSSSSEAVIAYERERLERAGYGVIVTPLTALPGDGALGNDVVVGTITAKATSDAVNMGAVALQTEGGAVNGVALEGGVLVVLRRRWYLDSMKYRELRISDAVRLRPYKINATQNGKQ